MLIEEQIKIARLIASGTPREVAIELTEVSDEYYDSAIRKTKEDKVARLRQELKQKKNKPQDKAKSRLDKVRQAGQKVGSNLKTAVLNARERMKERMADRKAQAAASAATAVLKPIEKVDSKDKITKDEGDATATSKAIGNIRKTTVQGINLGKRIITGRKARKDPIDYDKLAKSLNKEEFIQEVEDKKDSKAKKVIDIMRGKNSIKINPDVKEDTVVVQDASGKDFVEIVDIITPQKVRSDWRKEINVTEASAAWQRKEGKSKSGGLNEKGRKSYERQNPGSDLKAPSKKVGNKRRASFCARMKGMKKKLTSAKTARDPNSRINKSLRAWNC